MRENEVQIIPAAPGYYTLTALETNSGRQYHREAIIAWMIEILRMEEHQTFGSNFVSPPAMPITINGSDEGAAILTPDGSVEDCRQTFDDIKTWLPYAKERLQADREHADELAARRQLKQNKGKG